MILYFDNDQQVRGDCIIRAALRSDMAPVPVTLECDLRADESVLPLVAEGKIITTGHGDRLRIVSSQPITGNYTRGERLDAMVRLVAFLDECAPVTFVRERAIIKEKQTLHALYRAAGCSLRSVSADFPVPRFVCMVGDTPSFHIARALQEAFGIVRWKSGRLQFMTLRDLMNQKPVTQIPASASDDVKSSFLERHEAPAFFSIAPDGSVIHGARNKARAASFAPHQSLAQLNNMGRVLVRRKESKIDYSGQICAGDVIDYMGAKPLAIITACHYFESGTDRGGVQKAYTKVWCGEVL